MERNAALPLVLRSGVAALVYTEPSSVGRVDVMGLFRALTRQPAVPQAEHPSTPCVSDASLRCPRQTTCGRCLALWLLASRRIRLGFARCTKRTVSIMAVSSGSPQACGTQARMISPPTSSCKLASRARGPPVFEHTHYDCSAIIASTHVLL